jgi:hypothetical protein
MRYWPSERPPQMQGKYMVGGHQVHPSEEQRQGRDPMQQKAVSLRPADKRFVCDLLGFFSPSSADNIIDELVNNVLGAVFISDAVRLWHW